MLGDSVQHLLVGGGGVLGRASGLALPIGAAWPVDSAFVVLAVLLYLGQCRDRQP
ncbi:hypothetical protein [Mycobacteroides immunogenum]|uniref:hypothetical protein n=1 Tax=Mycobacteroides immunogenum TaxID=83262 RepID=UPI0013F4D3B6|nr:hypothetical protein [Mycobacteroides immunogenum]